MFTFNQGAGHLHTWHAVSHRESWVITTPNSYRNTINWVNEILWRAMDHNIVMVFSDNYIFGVFRLPLCCNILQSSNLTLLTPLWNYKPCVCFIGYIVAACLGWLSILWWILGSAVVSADIIALAGVRLGWRRSRVIDYYELFRNHRDQCNLRLAWIFTSNWLIWPHMMGNSRRYGVCFNYT